MKSFKVFRRVFPHGDVTYFYPTGMAAPDPTGGVHVKTNVPAFSLVSRRVAAHQTGIVRVSQTLGTLEKQGGVFSARLGHRARDPQSDVLLMVMFPEGGPVEMRIGKKRIRVHANEYGVLYTDQPYQIETVPQPVVTHRMALLINRPYWEEVWRHSVEGSGLVPRLKELVRPRTPLLQNLVRLAFRTEHGVGAPSIHRSGGPVSPRRRSGRTGHPAWLARETQIRQILHWMFHEHPHELRGHMGEIVLPPIQDVRVQTALEYLKGHLGDRQAVQQAAHAAGLHRNTLAVRMQKAIGISPLEYLMRFRIERAQALLRQSNVMIADVAAEAGYDSPNHFAKIFQAATGMTPQAYRGKLKTR